MVVRSVVPASFAGRLMLAGLVVSGLLLLLAWRDRSALAWLSPSPSFELHAHRGALGTHPPGNTLLAYRAGLREGATTVECDLRLSEDGVLVASHDPELSKECTFTGGEPPPTRKIAQLTAQQLALFDCHPEIPQVQPPARLDEILTLVVDRKVGLNAECKPEGTAIAEAVSRQITRRNQSCEGCLEELLTIQSFHPEHLQKLANLAKNGALRPRLSFLSPGHTLRDLQGMKGYVDVYSPSVKTSNLDGPTINKITQAGFVVIPWTVNDPYQMCQFARFGVRGVITDYPARLAPLAKRINATGKPPDRCSASL